MTDSRPGQIVVLCQGEYRFVSVADVDYLSAANRYVRVHCAEAQYLISGPLTALARDLAAWGFLPISRSIVVNTDRIDRLVPAGHGDLHVFLTSGLQLRMTRKYRGKFLKRHGKASLTG